MFELSYWSKFYTLANNNVPRLVDLSHQFIPKPEICKAFVIIIDQHKDKFKQ